MYCRNDLVGKATMRILVALVVLGGFVFSACGDDGGGDGDVAAFCDAADRIEQAEPFDHVDDLDAFHAEIDEAEAALNDAQSNAPAEISDEVEAVVATSAAVYAALRELEDPSNEAEAEAALAGVDTAGSESFPEVEAYLVENCDNRSSEDSE